MCVCAWCRVGRQGGAGHLCAPRAGAGRGAGGWGASGGGAGMEERVIPLDGAGREYAHFTFGRHGGQRWGMGIIMMRWFEIFVLEEGGRWRWGRERGRAIPLDGAGREYAYFPFVWGGLLGEGLVKIASR
jgi:hypothetical protein